MLRRMKKRFLDWPLAQKFVFVFSLMTLLSGALMVGALHLGLSVFEEKFYEKSLQELDFFLQRVDGDIQEVDTLTRSIAVDSAVRQQLGELAAADPETATYYYLLTGVRPLLLEKLYQSRQLSSIQYTDLYGHTLTIGEEMPDPAPEHGAQMEALLEQKAGGFALLPPVDADYPYLLCGRAILQSKNVSLAPLGTVIAALDVGALLDGEIGSLSTPPSELYLYSGGQLVYSSSGSGAAFTLPESGQGYRISTLGGKKYFLCWMTSRLTGMRLCSVFDYNQIYGQTSAARNALIAGECAILLLFAWVLLRMARFVTRPIHTLSEAVQVVEGGDFAAARAQPPGQLDGRRRRPAGPQLHRHPAAALQKPRRLYPDGRRRPGTLVPAPLHLAAAGGKRHPLRRRAERDHLPCGCVRRRRRRRADPDRPQHRRARAARAPGRHPRLYRQTPGPRHRPEKHLRTPGDALPRFHL